MEIFKYILILLSCSVIFVVICRRFHLPAIIGYLSVGMVVGPGGFGWLPTIEDMNHLAEFGIVFLMFTLGLEFSIPRLIATKRILLGLGGLQVIICTAIGTCAAWLLGLNIVQSLIIGGGLSISEKADEYSVMTYVLDSKDFVFTGGEFGIESSIIALLGYVIDNM